jgi:hypothetical protein
MDLMGIDFGMVGYLNYCSLTGLGMVDLNRIEVIGEQINNHIKHYKFHENIEDQLIWKRPSV